MTDVELQRELLIYRFGFLPQNIISLTDKQATRENIEIAFFEHLINQAKKDDIVLIHFSGLGRKVIIDSSTDDNSKNIVNTIIPVNGINDNFANDITLETLFALMQCIVTKKVTMVLDTSYEKSSLYLCEKLSIRSYLQDTIPTLNSQELLYSQDLKNKLKNNFQLNLNTSEKSGLILSATKEGIAKELQSSKFNVGLFTYVLTQYLWESIPSNNIWVSLGEISSRIVLFTSGREKPDVNLNLKENIYPYYIYPSTELAGQAIVTTIDKDKKVNFDLIGLPISVLSNYQLNSCFQIQNTLLENNLISLLELNGNKAKGIVLNPNLILNEGDILREKIRILPRNLGLNITLDDQLERIEKVDATSSLSSIDEIKSVVQIGENYVDCILGKVAENNTNVKNYALFSPTGILLPNTLGNNPNEAVSSAVKRFMPSFKILLARKILNLMFNLGSSLLPISASLEMKNNDSKIVITKETFANKSKKLVDTTKIDKNKYEEKSALIPTLSMSNEILINITNNSEKNIYFILLEITSSGKIIVYFSPENNVILPHENVNIPKNSNSLKWIIDKSKGLGELVLICSYSPFKDTFMKMSESISLKPEDEQIISLKNPVEICQTLLNDVHNGSQVSSNLVNNINEVYALDVNSWASFNFVYQIS